MFKARIKSFQFDPCSVNDPTTPQYFDKPVMVPRKVGLKDAFMRYDDHKINYNKRRIFMLPKECWLHPLDWRSNLWDHHAFAHDDWWHRLMKRPVYATWCQQFSRGYPRGTDEWDRIFDHLSRQSLMTVVYRNRPSTWIDFFYFDTPEVIAVPLVAPEPRNPYQLLWSTEHKYYFFLHFVGVPARARRSRTRA